MSLDIKKETHSVLFGIGFVIILLLIIKFAQFNVPQIIFFLIWVQILLQVYFIGFKKTEWQPWKQVQSAATTCLLIPFIVYLARFGIWGFIITIVVICGYILIKNRQRYILAKHHIETLIWGKPLKDYVAESKAPPKLKVSWR